MRDRYDAAIESLDFLERSLFSRDFPWSENANDPENPEYILKEEEKMIVGEWRLDILLNI